MASTLDLAIVTGLRYKQALEIALKVEDRLDIWQSGITTVQKDESDSPLIPAVKPFFPRYQSPLVQRGQIPPVISSQVVGLTWL